MLSSILPAQRSIHSCWMSESEKGEGRGGGGGRSGGGETSITPSSPRLTCFTFRKRKQTEMKAVAAVIGPRHQQRKGKETMHSVNGCAAAMVQCQRRHTKAERRRTLHAVLSAKPLLPEGTLALVFRRQQHQVGFLRGEEGQRCTDHLHAHTHTPTHIIMAVNHRQRQRNCGRQQD